MAENVTLEMVYSEIKKLNQRVATLEHRIIPEERLSEDEIKELDDLVADAKKSNVTAFSKIKK
jgi:vacuolar-type H+-ATPase subunit D/Vma8